MRRIQEAIKNTSENDSLGFETSEVAKKNENWIVTSPLSTMERNGLVGKRSLLDSGARSLEEIQNQNNVKGKE
mgnify:CR=1 FL=1